MDIIKNSQAIDPDTLDLIRTAKEKLITGGSPERTENFSQDDWDTPLGILEGKLTIKEVDDMRNKIGHIEDGPLGAALGFVDKSACISLSELDENTGVAKENPRIIGLWDMDKNEIIKVEGRDLTQEVYKMYKDAEVDLHLKETTGNSEKENPSSEQKG